MKRAKTDSDKQKRLKQILVTAKKVFIKNRFEGATIREIAAKANLTPAAIYLYFKSKDELYGAILEPVYRRNNDILLKVANSHGEIFDRLQAVLNAYLKIIVTDKEANLLDIKINALKLSTGLRRRLEKLNIEFFDIVIGIIREGIEDGCVAADTDPVAIGYSMMSTIDGLCIYEEYGDLSFHNLKLEDVMSKHLNIFWKGLFKH
jgi:AcrR family transcriptional regulator